MLKDWQRWTVGSLGTAAIFIGQSSLAVEVRGTAQSAIADEIKPVSKRAADLLGQAPPATTQPIRITGVKLNPTDAGLEVILETKTGTTLKPVTRTEGNALIAEISNATLALTEGPGFTANQPAVGVATVSVTQADAKTVRVSIVGAETVPTASVKFSLSTPTAQKPTTSEEEMVEGEEEEIVATGQKEGGYAVPNSSVGTRTDAAIKDVPQSIQVVPQQVIKDQGITKLDDALNNVSGVSSGGLGGFLIRGFGTLGSIKSNGASISETENRPNFSLGNVEQIEVLKGPASVLYGTGGPGGTINLTTKQPEKEPSYEIGATIGNFDYYNPSLDFTGPLNKEKTILYRLNVEYKNTGSFIDFVEGEEISIFPVISFQLGEKTKLTLEGGYRNQSSRGTGENILEENFLPAIGTLFSNPNGKIPLSRNLGEPDFARYNVEQWSVGYLLEHQFSDNWSIRNQFSAFISDQPRRFFDINSLETDNRTLTRTSGAFRIVNESYTLTTDLKGKFTTGIVKHDLLVGLELGRSVFKEFLQSFPNTSSIDIFNPEYGNIPDESELETFTDGVGTGDTIGVYIQDLLSIGDKVKIILGGRYDWVFSKFEDRLNNSSFTDSATAFAPRAGIVYQPIEPVSLYASWSRSFEPQFDVDRLGNPFVPITGEQFEVGVKADLFDKKLSTTLSAYQITRQNDFQPDPVDPNNFSIQIGEQRSRGIEFDLSGEPLPGLRLIASYAYTDAKITKDTTGLQGTRVNDTPRHSGSFWAVYEFQKGSLKGLGLGAGVFVVDKRFATGGQFAVPAQAITNALVYYRRNNWKVQLNFDNLFNALDVNGVGSESSVIFGAPFTIRGQVSFTF